MCLSSDKARVPGAPGLPGSWFGQRVDQNVQFPASVKANCTSDITGSMVRALEQSHQLNGLVVCGDVEDRYCWTGLWPVYLDSQSICLSVPHANYCFYTISNVIIFFFFLRKKGSYRVFILFKLRWGGEIMMIITWLGISNSVIYWQWIKMFLKKNRKENDCLKFNHSKWAEAKQ